MSVIPIPSNRVMTQARAGWEKVKDVCESLPKPQKGTINWFKPTDECIRVIDYVIEEYPRQVVQH